ncbi:ABC transporter permease [Pelagibius sp.]|uniref:ABC transporter permease n=1 Tax=Pelagibius sp. TaxID=1931238 RepID=UPI003BB0F6ED
MTATTSMLGLPWRSLPVIVRAHQGIAFGGTVILLFALFMLFAPVLAPYDPTHAMPTAVLRPPDARFLLGTDSNGMDILSRLIYGSRYAFAVAVPSLLVMLVVGVPVGLLAGYVGGWADEVLIRTTDVLRAFPTIIFALAVVAAVGPSLATLVLVIGLLDAPLFARLVRAEALALRQGTLVESAVVAGNAPWRILFVHLLPNCIQGTSALAALRMGWAIRISATLSFVGVGIQPPTPEWGVMIRLGAEHIVTGKWWVVLFPSLALVLLVLAFNAIGDGLGRALDPRQENRSR